MRRALYPFRTSRSPHLLISRKKVPALSGMINEIDITTLISEVTFDTMEPQPISTEDGSQASQMRQPKKRFVGRRAADAQAQKESTGQKDVESTAVQTGISHIASNRNKNR